MNMKDVKAITIPQGSVKKIEDSNGNIIWGSASAFPYRRLEYIKFSGAEYVNTWLTIPGNTSYKRFDLKVNLQNITNWGVNGTDSNGNIRFNIGVNGNGYTRIGVGNQVTWADGDGVLLALNTDYTLSLEVNGNAVGRVYDAQGTLIGSGATLSSISFSGNPNVLYIGASNYDNTVSSYLEEKVYNVVIRLGSASNLTSNFIPCQRKSDNVCGFYDTVRNAFYLMQGTTITDGAAGPILDEYWDLTAPE